MMTSGVLYFLCAINRFFIDRESYHLSGDSHDFVIRFVGNMNHEDGREK